MQKIILLDLSKNYKIERFGSTYINLSNGSINLINCKKHPIKINLNYKSTKHYKDYLSFFKEKLKFINKLKLNFCANEIEYFNIRHDKIQFFNKLYFLSKIYSEINFRKIDLEIISDDENMEDAYKSLSSGKIYINLLSKKKKKNLFFYFITRRIWFNCRACIYTLLIKIFLRNNFKTNKNLCLSLFPNFYNKNNKEVFFQKIKKKSYLNFLITDETHLNNNVNSIFSSLKILRNKNLITPEKKIKFYDLCKNFFNILKELGPSRAIIKKNFYFKKIDFTYPIQNLLVKSYLNRLKLKIYDKPLVEIIKNSRNFHLYLFEYSFGFYIINLIKNNCKNTNLTGYQHGIFNKNLMWLDNQNCHILKYYPNTIVSSAYSSTHYKFFYRKSKISIRRGKSNFLLNLKKKINKKHKNKNLVLLGLHDFKDMLLCLSRYSKKNPQIIFYIKKHPKIRVNNDLFISNKNFIFINKMSNISYSKVILSETSSLTQDFSSNKIPFSIFGIPYKIPILNHEYSKSIIRV